MKDAQKIADTFDGDGQCFKMPNGGMIELSDGKMSTFLEGTHILRVLEWACIFSEGDEATETVRYKFPDGSGSVICCMGSRRRGIIFVQRMKQ